MRFAAACGWLILLCAGGCASVFDAPTQKFDWVQVYPPALTRDTIYVEDANHICTALGSGPARACSFNNTATRHCTKIIPIRALGDEEAHEDLHCDGKKHS